MGANQNKKYGRPHSRSLQHQVEERRIPHQLQTFGSFLRRHASNVAPSIVSHPLVFPTRRLRQGLLSLTIDIHPHLHGYVQPPGVLLCWIEKHTVAPNSIAVVLEIGCEVLSQCYRFATRTLAKNLNIKSKRLKLSETPIENHETPPIHSQTSRSQESPPEMENWFGDNSRRPSRWIVAPEKKDAGRQRKGQEGRKGYQVGIDTF